MLIRPLEIPPLNRSTAPSAFASLGLSQPALEALAQAGFSAPTPIQQQAIGPALDGHDVIGCAATGTGKTLAFLLPIIERLAGQRGCRALVLAPTRELALQILEQLEQFGNPRGVRGSAIIGGAPMGPQLRALREQRSVIVATPGRLVDHIQQRTVDLRAIEVLVLDEADRMLDMGFRSQLDAILGRLPRPRQSLLFSATMAGEVAKFARSHLRNPVRVEVARSGTIAQGAAQVAYHVEESDKAALLLSLLAQNEETTLVFTRTQHRADKLAKTLARSRHRVTRIHGGRSQSQRQQALQGFKDGEFRVLVATDIAARGIDVVGIGHVVAYDISRVPEDHVHRIGRTARAEAVGRASSLVSREERPLLRDIEGFTRIPIDRANLPADMDEWKREIERGRAAAQERGGPPARGGANAGRRGRVSAPQARRGAQSRGPRVAVESAGAFRSERQAPRPEAGRQEPRRQGRRSGR